MARPPVSVAEFAAVARRREPALDELALALAGELRPVDAAAALDSLDRLGAEVREAADDGGRAGVEACRLVLGERHGFRGDADDYDSPDNSMLDLVLDRRRGLPILLSVVWIEVARRAGIELRGVGLPGHYVVGAFAGDRPRLVDPFAGGAPLDMAPTPEHVRPWGAHESELRMLDHLVPAYARRGDLGRPLRAARLRLHLPLDDPSRRQLEAELRSLQARLN